MTRKDFTAVARMMADLRKHTGRYDESGNTVIYAKDVEQRLAAFFASDNPRFDRDRFLNACQGHTR